MSTQPQSPQNSQKVLRKLQDALRRGVAAGNILWTFPTTDWVKDVHAADIDDDGDIEILVVSRDGYIYALTRWGARKWQRLLKREHISTVFAVPPSEITQESQAPRIILGTRSGKVLALDKSGEQLPDWKYDTGRVIRQIYISAKTPENVIVGSEDRCIHVLDTATGKPRWEKYRTEGWVRCVFSCDIDGDGKEEILGGSGDKNLYILDHQGKYLHKLSIGYEVYALYAAQLEDGGPVKIIVSSNRQDLAVWTVTRQGEMQWNAKKEWSRDNPFENRVHSIYVADINNDGIPEILVGSEDKHLYIFDHHGTPLWKQYLGSCVYAVHAMDINFDGRVEIIVGTEHNSAYVLNVALSDNLYKGIQDACEKAVCIPNKSEIMRKLSPREKELLNDFIGKRPSLQHTRMEMDVAIDVMKKERYEEALSIFLRLLQQRVQYYWSEPVQMEGAIWTECFGNIAHDRTDEILVGTDDGYIYAIDIQANEEKQLWAKLVGNRVRSIQTGIKNPGGYDSIVAVLSNYRLVMLDNTGAIIKEHTFKHMQDWAHSVSIHQGGDGRTSEIVIAQNQKVSIWDADLWGETDLSQEPVLTIDTAQGIEVVHSYKPPDGNTDEIIISGSIGNHVYAHNRQGKELWRFETQERVHALRVEDIDKDGRVEIIVGSEDRYVYVLDDHGHLKWRYRTGRSVLDVDICDIKLENDPEEQEERTWKVLVSSSDNYLYMLDADGNLLWKYKGNNRIRTARAKDLNHDGKYEIALATENQLELLQILDRTELLEYIERCWEALLDPDDGRSSIMKFTRHPDEYIRAFALNKLAGQHSRHEEDFKRFQEALREEDSLQVKMELVRAIVVLCCVPYSQGENKRQARLLLQQLARDPDEDIRFAIVRILPLLIEVDEVLCFEYFEYFINNVNVWVRCAVVRRLDKIVKEYPKQVFKQLMKVAADKDEWVRQEAGCVLAHYFDAHPELLVRDMLALLYRGTDPAVLQQISYSAKTGAVQRLFQGLVKQLKELSGENMADMLDEATSAMEEANKLGSLYGQELLQVYEEFQELFHTRTISDIAGYQRITRPDMDFLPTYGGPSQVMQVFDALQQVVQIVRMYERREAMRDRAASLIDATVALDKIRSDLHEGKIQQTQKLAGIYRLPENMILTYLIQQWSKVIRAELNRLRGDARLIVEIRNKEVQLEEEVVISFAISNQGTSPADNVRVVLEDSPDFDSVGSSERFLTEVSTTVPVSVDFTIRPHTADSFRLSVQLTYDDDEGKARQAAFADVVAIREHQCPYRGIPNPYTSGTPIRDKHMFYGRQADLASLQEKMSSTSGANKVIVLTGQRRVGKTSLIYQLANELSQGPYASVFIDMQSLALVSDVGQLLMGFAARIYDEVLHYKGIHVTAPNPEIFNSNPTAAFNDYLAQVLQALPGQKLVFLLDEFEKLHEQIKNNRLNQDILNYLRSLMQHFQGLNFLLAGASPMRALVVGYWSIFYNIAVPHWLSKLKPDEATALITQPISEYLEYDSLALERVRSLTGDQPYLIHVVSEKVIAHCNKHQKSYVTVNDVNAVLDLILEEQTSSIRWIWDDDSLSPTGKFILSLLAQEKGEEGRVFTLNDLRAAFDAQGVPYEQKGVGEGLQHLVSEDIVEEKHDGTQFRIPVGLTKEWLRKDKPPERVVREELSGDE